MPDGDLTPPGVPPFDAELERRLQAALEAEGASYRPRTRHLDGKRPRFANRLLLESSPYLRQHAHNPVNWYPWGEEAFSAAAREGRPVFLSIGYSTCHWCHVMEEESFEDLEIARFLNEHFVSIKVDREERPDVDAIYMAAVMGLTGRGGWPMTVFLSPDKAPFFGGTYFPARDGDRGPHRGFLSILGGVLEAYRNDPDGVAETTGEIARVIRLQLAPPRPSGLPDEDVARRALGFYRGRFDEERGGMRVQQKFPSSLPIRLLLRLAERFDDDDARRMAKRTLDAMADGGLHDQAGGGFHRYATDPDWLVPHFEKMLYDNALLTLAYLEGWQAYGEERYAEVARDTLAYVERGMTSPAGAFYSATDADSLSPEGDRQEGWYFTWTPAELEAELRPDLAAVAISFYGVRPGGNFEGRSILHRPRSEREVAAELGLDVGALRAKVRTVRERLTAARSERPAPLRDEKILTSWNGLMIRAFARAAVALGEERYAEVAARAADFLLEHAQRDGRLLRTCRHRPDGGVEAKLNAYLDDYAFLIAGLLDLLEATGERRWLDEAERLAEVVRRRYADPEAGGFFMTSDDHEALLVREKPSQDGAEPSGASVHAENLVRLAGLTDDERYRRQAEGTLRAYGEIWERAPHALSEMLLAWDRLSAEGDELVIVGRDRVSLRPMLDEVRTRFRPHTTSLALDVEQARALADRVVVVQGRTEADRPTAYLCRGTICELPSTDRAALRQQLDEAAAR